MQLFLEEVETSLKGFSRILGVYQNLRSSNGMEHTIDMSQVTWLDANMCAFFGAVLRRLKHEGHSIHLINTPNGLWNILHKNGFAARFIGSHTMTDTYETAIRYQEFGQNHQESFKIYVKTHFRPGSRGLPEMTPLLLRKFRESLFEIYLNSDEHSDTKLGIFACGQFFPNKKLLKFSIADLGIGFRERIVENTGMSMTATNAIQWAVSGNSTRKGRPGGLGLGLIREFTERNMGRISILSDAGYWTSGFRESRTGFLEVPFCGTVVTLTVNTADKTSYRTMEEVDPAQIF